MAYVADRIIGGFLDYKVVVEKHPNWKKQLDELLIQLGRGDLIVEPSVPMTDLTPAKESIPMTDLEPHKEVIPEVAIPEIKE